MRELLEARVWRALLLAMGLIGALSAGAAAEPQRRSLLVSDGTLYEVRSGLASDLSVTWPGVEANDFVVVWHATAQDGSVTSGVIPGTPNQNAKTSLDLTFDEPTGSLVVLWREEAPVLNKIRLAIAQAGAWRVVDLLPNPGFPHAYNPQMLLTHQVVRSQDDEGADVLSKRSILSVIWWEESHFVQARYVGLFLDEELDKDSAVVYDLPELVGDIGPTSVDGVPRGAYAFPALQAEGLGGNVLASFADLASRKHYVVRIAYPTDLGKPGIDNPTWLRRRIPVVGVAGQGPISVEPSLFSLSSVHTAVGGSFLPTLYWGDPDAVRYIRFDGTAWSPVKAVLFTDEINYDRAVALVEGMAFRN